jgi:hypothetical protein
VAYEMLIEVMAFLPCPEFLVAFELEGSINRPAAAATLKAYKITIPMKEHGNHHQSAGSSRAPMHFAL